jgi:hypothetical protein
MKEPEGEGPPRPSLQLLPLADDPKGAKKRRRARRRPKEDGAARTDDLREDEPKDPADDS